MNNNYLNIYNNLIKLTRNKLLYAKMSENESFSDRLIIFFFHFGFFLKIYKTNVNSKELQNLYNYVFKQIELSLREIGYGDVSINKNMKKYVNLMYSIIDKIELWEKLNLNEKSKFISKYLNVNEKSSFFTDYFNKYIDYLTKKSFNYFTKEVISLKF